MPQRNASVPQTPQQEAHKKRFAAIAKRVTELRQRISYETLAQRLNAAVGANVGIEGLNTLLYGWKRKRRYGLQYLNALKHRNWLYITEVMDFSEYAGCDLTAPRSGEI